MKKVKETAKLVGWIIALIVVISIPVAIALSKIAVAGWFISLFS